MSSAHVVVISAKGFIISSLAPGPHPQRELTLMPRLGSPCPRLRHGRRRFLTGAGAPVPLSEGPVSPITIRPVVAVETVRWFPRSLWARFVRPQLRQLLQACGTRPMRVASPHDSNSADLTGAPTGPCALSARGGSAPRQVRPWCTSSGESRHERQYRDEDTPRTADQHRRL